MSLVQGVPDFSDVNKFVTIYIMISIVSVCIMCVVCRHIKHVIINKKLGYVHFSIPFLGYCFCYFRIFTLMKRRMKMPDLHRETFFSQCSCSLSLSLSNSNKASQYCHQQYICINTNTTATSHMYHLMVCS